MASMISRARSSEPLWLPDTSAMTKGVCPAPTRWPSMSRVGWLARSWSPRRSGFVGTARQRRRGPSRAVTRSSAVRCAAAPRLRYSFVSAVTPVTLWCCWYFAGVTAACPAPTASERQPMMARPVASASLPVRTAGRVAAAAVLALVGTTGVVRRRSRRAGRRARPVPSERVEVHPATAPRAALGADLPREPRPGCDHGTARWSSAALAVVGATWEPGAIGDADVIQLRVRRDGRWQSVAGDGGATTSTDPTPGAPRRSRPRARPGTHALRRGRRAGAGPGRHDQAGRARRSRSTSSTPAPRRPTPRRARRAAGSATAAAARPTILTRADWGADESLRKGTPDYGQAQVGLRPPHRGDQHLHQRPGARRSSGASTTSTSTAAAGTTSATSSSSTGSGGSGRAGTAAWTRPSSARRPSGYNSGSFGASVMGDFTLGRRPPSAVTTRDRARLIAWKFTLHGIPATGTVSRRWTRPSTASPATATRTRPLPRADASTTGSPRSARRSPPGDGQPVAVGAAPVGRRRGHAGRPVLPAAAWRRRGSTPRGRCCVGVAPAGRVGACGSARGGGACATSCSVPDLTGDGRPTSSRSDPSRSALRIYRGDGRGGFAGMSVRGGGLERHDPARRRRRPHRRRAGRPARACAPTEPRAVRRATARGGSARGASSAPASARCGSVDGRRRRHTVTAAPTCSRWTPATGVLLLHPGRADGGVGTAGHVGHRLAGARAGRLRTGRRPGRQRGRPDSCASPTDGCGRTTPTRRGA